ncbi:MAG: hypothetical protein ACREMA_16855 [Longimicrobiales bacterium]
MAYDVDVLSLPDVYVADLPIVDVDVIDLPLVEVDVNSLADFSITEIGSVGAVGPVTLAGIPSSYTVAISHLPDLNLRIREIPSIRAHIPANFRLGFSIFGVELAALHLCGEAQVITEPFVPNPCERCGTAARPTPNQPGITVGAVLRLKD